MTHSSYLKKLKKYINGGTMEKNWVKWLRDFEIRRVRFDKLYYIVKLKQVCDTYVQGVPRSASIRIFQKLMRFE